MILTSFPSLFAEGKGERLPIPFGHQDDTFYGIGWDARDGGEVSSDIRRVCGEYPVVMGFELSGIELDHERNIDHVPFTLMRQEIQKQLQRGGIVTLSWHPDNPLTGKNAWDVSSNAVVKSVLPGGSCHADFIQRIKRLCAFIKTLTPNPSTCNPIIFRPWHENNGSWFWWGKDLCTAQEYKALWNMLQDTMIAQGLTNLIWSYSPNYNASLTIADFLTRYPGDDRVQLLGLDAYQNGTRQEFQTVLDTNLWMLCNYAQQHGKEVALTECGYRSVPDSKWWTGALLPVIQKYPLKYVLCWRNENLKERFAPYKGSNDSRDFRKFAKKVIMLKQ